MKAKNVNRILIETKQIYDKIAPSFAITRDKWWQAFGNFQKYVKDRGSVLDLGCGNGRMAKLFENTGISYLGIDNSQELIKIGKERFKDHKNISFEVGDVVDLHLADNSCDLILMIAALHHIPTKELRLKILADIYKAMKNDSVLVLYNWNLWQWGYRKKYWPRLLDYKFKIKNGVWSLKDAFIPWKLIGNTNQRYVHSFALGELKKLLIKSGFKIESADYENFGKRASFFNGFNSVVIARKK
ncbi:MAG: class I SAM-dependent methyltransferase [Candidatus Buchananbacteria bacterium]